jgi:hypothetical protein
MGCLPWWLVVSAYLLLSGPAGLVCGMLLQPAAARLLPRAHVTLLLCRWALMTAAGSLVDAQLQGSPLAAWATRLLSLVAMVGLSPLGVAWARARLGRKYLALAGQAARQQGASSSISSAKTAGGGAAGVDTQARSDEPAGAAAEQAHCRRPPASQQPAATAATTQGQTSLEAAPELLTPAAGLAALLREVPMGPRYGRLARFYPARTMTVVSIKVGGARLNAW